MTKYILSFLAGLLLIVIVIEIVYLFFFRDKTKSENQLQSNESQVLPNNVSVTSAITPKTGSPNKEDIKNLDKFYNSINPNMALDPKVIYSHIFYKKGITQSSVINNVHRGEIFEIDRTTKKAFYDYYDSVLEIRLGNEKGEQGITFNFSSNDLSKTQFVKRENGKEIPIAPEELNEGDIIIIEDSIDAMYAEPITDKRSTYLTKSWGFNRIKTKIIKL